MNNQEPQSRMQRYNFNTDKQSASKRKPPKRPSHFRQILISILVTLVLVIGVGVWLANRSTKVENGAQNTEQSVNDNSSSSNTGSDSASENDTPNSNPNNSSAGSANGSTYADKGITSSQRSSLQSSINQESDATIKNSEQKKLDNTKPKGNTQQSSSSANTTSNSAGSSSKKTDNSNNNSGSITFSQPHTFSSVSDAKSWAQATKSQWLKDGYSNYTITSDAQGNYVLRFVK
ncbi:hypothetical protein HC026_06490 [Lactobacillus sp. LC28-10]|uniref:Uncharacterized protein n=1 Tax=Secundilactobacillus angelensis TaxID=2722706 RepID=A0ABX1KXD3_9LACO|nr:hypothetical protein [Secundilactobacillus angelensis]MCH5461732.1 hypothetical protein [Secundilactobacillus angelensis]NLR18571.1 hypothetical protein [Secundilactobacillus angelensis]